MHLHCVRVFAASFTLSTLAAAPAFAHQPPPIDISDIKAIGLGQECFAIDTGKQAPGAALEQNSICVAPDEITLISAGQQVASFKVNQRSVDNCKNCHRATYQVVGAAFAKITIAFNGRIDAKRRSSAAPCALATSAIATAPAAKRRTTNRSHQRGRIATPACRATSCAIRR